MKRRIRWCQFIPVSLLVFSTLLGAQQEPDLELTTADGHTLLIHSEISPLAINQIHSWVLELRNASGFVTGADITVQGGMPEHDHGLPTQPQVTEEISPGKYLIEGIRFHMPGAWIMEFTIQNNNDTTEAILEFQL